MDVVDNKHMERILEFTETNDLHFSLSRDSLKELPWCGTLQHVRGKQLFLAHGITLSDVLKLVSSYVQRIQSERIEPTPL